MATLFNHYTPLLAFFLLAFALSFTPMASAAGNGTAAYYFPDSSSACPKSTLGGSSNRFVAMVPTEMFNNGTACGQVYKISCTGATNNYSEQPCKKDQWVTVTVANLCGGTDCATFTVAADAFDIIAKRDSGRVQINYRRLRLAD